MKKIILLYACAALMLCGSCSDFLDTYPYDALSPATTWKTEADAEKFLTGCYDGWIRGEDLVEWDCQSDIGFAQHGDQSGTRNIGNGSVTAGNPGKTEYSYTRIRRCITFLENVDNAVFSDERVKKDMVAQVKTIRAYDYFKMNFLYGGVPIIRSFKDADEAKVPRNTEAEVKKYIYDELDAAIPDLNTEPKARGYVAKGAALAVKMRSALYWGDYQRALDAAKAIQALDVYELNNSYANLFTLTGRNSKEIILAKQNLAPNKGEWLISLLSDSDGGWSVYVPTGNLLDMYEMSNGKTKDEAASGYDATHPFKDRDPRMAMSVLYPGQDWQGSVRNTLDEEINGAKNSNYSVTPGSNASPTALSWSKYVTPLNQYDDIWNTDLCQIVFRYAEVLLTIAEASNELSGPSDEVYDALNEVRTRPDVNMPEVDRAAYGTKETLRELIRRERTVELAGEGHRRADILRWKDAGGKMLAETVLNGELKRMTGTVDYTETDPYKRATIDPAATVKIEDRVFLSHMRYLPIPQSNIDKNPQLKQNTGY
jgi:hypothetical protein